VEGAKAALATGEAQGVVVLEKTRELITAASAAAATEPAPEAKAAEGEAPDAKAPEGAKVAEKEPGEAK
jgi:hypothetical protein